MQIESLSLAALGDPPWTRAIPVAATIPPAACDVVVVGAGVTGLSVALALAEQHVEVTVLDQQVGGGATARSGGIVLGETLVGPVRAFDGCEYSLREWIVREQIDCDLTWTGCLELTRDPRSLGRALGWSDDGVLRVADEVAGGLLEPVKLLNGMLSAAMRAGARVVAGARVERVEAGVTGPLIRGTGFEIAARRAILAVDALSWTRAGDPWSERAITVVLQTTAEAELARSLGLQQPFYTREAPLLWGRALEDGSLLFGRELLPWSARCAPDELREQLAAAADRLARRVRRLHPRLTDVSVQRVWAGPTARSGTGVPALVDDPALRGVVWAGGYGGHGIAQAFRLGRRAAARVVLQSHDLRV